MKVGQIIWEQLRTMDMNLLMCMGVHQQCLIENGLQFKVRGLKFKGWVKIVLNEGQDLYEIELVKMKRKKNKEMSELMGKTVYDQNPETTYEAKGIYFDQLPELLEREVEGR